MQARYACVPAHTTRAHYTRASYRAHALMYTSPTLSVYLGYNDS